MVYSLQILRALSAISILIYHVLVNQYGEVPAVRVFSAGIVVFFIISGYIIARSTLARRIRVEPTFLAGAFIIALVATAAILSRTTPAAHWMKPYGTPLMLDFLAGVAIRWIEKRDLLNFRTELARRGFAASCAVSALLGFAAVAFGVLPYWSAAIPSVLLFMAFLQGNFASDSAGNQAGLYLGDASYSIYLFHALLLDLAFVHSGMLHLGDRYLTHAILAFCACLVFSLCMYHLIEKPSTSLSRLLTSRLSRPSSTKDAGTCATASRR